MILRRWIPVAALAVAAWMPAEASAQDNPRVNVGRQVEDATRDAADRVGRARTGAEGAVDEARGRAGDAADRVGDTSNRAAKLTEREILAKMARAESVHVERLAKLDRLRTLAEQSGDAAKVREVDALRAKEVSRRQRQVRNARGLIGDSAYDRYARQLRDAQAERKRRGGADSDEKGLSDRRSRNARKDAYGENEPEPQRRGAAPERGANPGRGTEMRDAAPPRGSDANRRGGNSTNTGRGNAPQQPTRGSSGNTRSRGNR